MNDVIECDNDTRYCINCKYWDEVLRKGHLKYRCVNDASVYYMSDTGAVQQCEDFEKM